MTDIDAVRARYRPEQIRVLFLGESPPPFRGFFYSGDSTLFTHTRDVMVERCSMPAQPERFLRAFQAAGFFLDDYSLKRGDKPAQRPNAPDTVAAVTRIGRLIRDTKPKAVVAMLLSIRGLVERSVDASGTAMSVRYLPFPYWKDDMAQQRYRRNLASILDEFGCATDG